MGTDENMGEETYLNFVHLTAAFDDQRKKNRTRKLTEMKKDITDTSKGAKSNSRPRKDDKIIKKSSMLSLGYFLKTDKVPTYTRNQKKKFYSTFFEKVHTFGDENYFFQIYYTNMRRNYTVLQPTRLHHV